MARSRGRFLAQDVSGQFIGNALLLLREVNGVTPLAGAWNAATGGAAITQVVTNAQGEGNFWLDVPRDINVIVTDNSNAAYLLSNPGTPVDFPDSAAELLTVYPDFMGGKPGQVLKVGPGGVLYWDYPIGSYPETHFIEHNDLAYHTLAAASTIGQISLRTTGAGASATTIVSEPGHPGIVELFTGTTVTGVAQFLAKSNGLFVVGAGLMFIEGVVRIPVLSDATDSFNVTVGFCDSASPAADISRRVLTYRHDINGGKWQACCSNLTVVDTGVPVVAGTWYRLRVEVDPILDQCRYYIDGALLTTITTNQPVDAQLFSTYPASIEKAAGTTTRSLQVDFYKLGQIYTAPRW